VIRFSGGFDPRQTTNLAMVNAIEALPEPHSVVRIEPGSDTQFIDWNSYLWSADRHFDGGHTIRSDSRTLQASPTLYDQALYQTARSGRTFGYSIPAAPGLYTVHLKFAELWLKETGQRTDEHRHKRLPGARELDPGAAAGQTGMAADFRVANVTPDGSGKITIRLSAVGSNDAILQGSRSSSRIKPRQRRCRT